MAATIQVPLLATVKVDVGSGLTTLGYTRAGSEIEVQPVAISVPGDAHGGDEGDEIDAQALPPIYTVRLQLTNFDYTVFAVIESMVNGGTGGTFAAASIGALYVGGSKAIRVCIDTANATWIRNFPLCRPVDAVSYNLGTRFAEASVAFKAIRNVSSGVIWNNSNS